MYNLMMKKGFLNTKTQLPHVKAQQIIKKKQKSGMMQAKGENIWKLEVICYFTNLGWDHFQKSLKINGHDHLQYHKFFPMEMWN